MQEVGQVKKVDGDYATVTVNKKDECSKCGMCLFPKNANATEFQAKNSADAKVGDTVLIEIKEGGKLPALLLVFLVPLILILLSSVIANTVIKMEIWTLWLSLISVAVWFAILPIIDKAIKKTQAFSVEVVKVIKSEKENENE